MRRLAVLAAVLVASSGAALAAQPAAPAPPAPPETPTIQFEKYSLPNGLEVILSQDRRLPLVAVNLWYHVGPVNEDAGRTGFAHLFEHMMFQGAKHVPADAHFKLLEGAGASTINGTTDFDRTNYFETLPSNQLELALWLESDRMGYLPDVLDQASLSNQQDVVRNERRQSVENQPYGIVGEELYHQLFPKDHPYYASVIGSHADIQAAKLEDVRRFFRTYYAPNNASLAIVGDFDTAEVKKLVEKYFGSLKRGPAVPKVKVTTPPITAERRVVVQDRVELPKLYLGWLTSPIYTPGDAEADLTSMILGGGKSSRLYKKLVYDLQIAQNVAASQQSLALGSVFTIEATARPGHTADELEKAIDAELAKFRVDGPTPQELERARNTIETQIVGGLESLGGFGGVADRLNQYNHFLGTPDYLKQDLDRYRTMTAAKIKDFAATQLRDSARVVVQGVPGTPNLGPDVPAPKAADAAPGTGAEGVNADEAWRAQPPKAAAARDLELPVPVSFKLSNGLTVLLAERRKVPVVSASLVFRTGSDANPADLPGLANFTAAMLDEGTTTRDALGIADAVAQIGGSLDTGSSTDASRASVRALRRNAGAAFDLLADVVLRPTFPAAEIERQRGQRLARLVQDRQSPPMIASKATAAALYGPAHPFGYPEIGTEASNKALTREQMQAFWRAHYVPNNAALVVAGAISADELRALAEKTFGQWAPGDAKLAVVPAPQPTKAKLVLVDKPGSPQTRLRVATIGVTRAAPDFPTLEVLNASLGGLFSSRINLNLREEHGYTYGAGSAFAYRRAVAGPFFVDSGVRTDVSGAAATEMFREIDRMSAEPLTAAELTLARDSIVRSLPGEFETSGSVAGSLASLYVYDLGLDYYRKLPRQIEAVTAADVQAAAKRHLDRDRMVVIAVGDRAKVEPQFESLKLGTPEVRDASGQLAKP